MKITYYPEDNHLVAVYDNGRMVGFKGGRAEKMFMQLLNQEIPVSIGCINRKSRPICRGDISSKN